MVAMSGGRVGSLVNDTFLAHAERLGAVGVLKKPFGLDLLIDTVDRALGGVV
jgi:FixJ family two-component response regulator